MYLNRAASFILYATWETDCEECRHWQPGYRPSVLVPNSTKCECILKWELHIAKVGPVVLPWCLESPQDSQWQRAGDGRTDVKKEDTYPGVWLMSDTVSTIVQGPLRFY